MAAKKVDWVKIIGLTIAIGALLGFHWHTSRKMADANAKYQLELKAWETAEAERKAAEEKRLAEAKTAEPKLEPVEKTGETKSGEIKSGENPEPKAPPAGQPPKEIAEAPPVNAVGGKLNVTFTSKGGAIKHAMLADIYAKSPKGDPAATPGMEILDELHPGKRSMALVSMQLGDTTYGDMESRVWELVEDSKGFAGPDEAYTVAYAATIHAKTEPYQALCRVTKRFKLGKNAEHVDLDITVSNLSRQPLTYRYVLRGAAGILIDGPPADPHQGAYLMLKAQLASRAAADAHPAVTFVDAATAGKPDEAVRSNSRDENLWATVHNRFFLAALIARNPATAIKLSAEQIQKGARTDKTGDLRYQEDNISVLLHRRESSDLAPDAASEADGFVLYLGPAQENYLSDFEASLKLPKAVHLNESVQYCDVFGWRWPNVDYLARFLLWIFKGIHGLVGNYGVAVILLTLLVKLALHPIQRKQSISMFKMQEIQPQLKAIEDRYAGATSAEMKQKKELEKLDLMRKAGANPLTGCLPMFLQMPILFALYGAFSHAFEIRQAEFLWIHDLSLSDRLYTVSFWPREINLLPVLYMGMTVAQTLMQPKPVTSDPQQEMQRKMFMFMPVMFGFLFYRMPSGLLLYFAASATFGMLESWYIKKYVLKQDPNGTVPAAPVSGSPIPGVKTAVK